MRGAEGQCERVFNLVNYQQNEVRGTAKRLSDEALLAHTWTNHADAKGVYGAA